MTAFLLQNLKLIMLFLLIGSILGLASVQSESRLGSVAAKGRSFQPSGRASAILGISTRIVSAVDRAFSRQNGKALEPRSPQPQLG